MAPTNAYAKSRAASPRMRPTLFKEKLSLLARLVVQSSDGFGLGLLVLSRHLVRPEFVGQLVNRPGKVEGQRVAVVHPRAGIAADVEGLVEGHEDRNRVRDRTSG